MSLYAPKQQPSERFSKVLPSEYSRQRLRSSLHSKPFSIPQSLKPLERDHSTQGGVRSQSIPISKSALRRSPSELKLYEDEAMADFQDYVFFSRLLKGISKQQQESVSDTFLQESDECLAHIIGTRNGSLDDIATQSAKTTPYKSFGEYANNNSSAAAAAAAARIEERDEGIFVMDF